MATYYIDPVNGNDADDGLSWANAFLTLNGAEDEPVAAGDTVYVGPGVYRELLTCDVSGGGVGTPITYIGDVTGENTDGVGGIVRITASDDDQTATRDYCINGTLKEYRTFRGFQMDTAALYGVYDFGIYFILEDCVIILCYYAGMRVDGNTPTGFIVRRCIFSDFYLRGIWMVMGVEESVAGLIENCSFIAMTDAAVYVEKLDDLVVKNCMCIGVGTGVRAVAALAGTIDVNNCIFESIGTALRAAAAGDLVEDYNTFFNNDTDRTNVNVGGNSVTYPALFRAPILLDGYKFPWCFGELSEWSQVRAITGTSEPSDDLFGIGRPATAAKNSWGPVQFHDMERETTTTRTGGVSMTLHDAGLLQIWVPVTAVSTTISVYVYREANYAGTNPRLIVKQPGVADDVTTDANAASQWNLLTTTLTPAADPPYVVVELQSLNTAVALAYDVFFDDLVVS